MRPRCSTLRPGVAPLHCLNLPSSAVFTFDSSSSYKLRSFLNDQALWFPRCLRRRERVNACDVIALEEPLLLRIAVYAITLEMYVRLISFFQGFDLGL